VDSDPDFLLAKDGTCLLEKLAGAGLGKNAAEYITGHADRSRLPCPAAGQQEAHRPRTQDAFGTLEHSTGALLISDPFPFCFRRETVDMASAAAEENLNAAGKLDAEIVHAERIVAEDEITKTEDHGMSPAEIRKFTLKQDWRVLPMLGVIYAVSIIDRINVRICSYLSPPCLIIPATPPSRSPNPKSHTHTN